MKKIIMIIVITLSIVMIPATKSNAMDSGLGHNTLTNYYNDSTLYQTDNFATYYFCNLTDNFGWNLKGSCSYIAFAMLLSYYDTY